MSNSRTDVLAAARAILAEHSLADLTMRRLATDLGVRPNALYWHFPNKQTMLAALADDILDAVEPPTEGSAPERIRSTAVTMRAALLAVPDSAEIVSSAWASGLSHRSTVQTIVTVARDGGLDEQTAAGVATAVCQLTIGLTIEEQTRTQMERLGVTGPSGRDFDSEFAGGLDVIVAGARARATASTD
ncbi:TetR family transcriptional regulator [Gordonia sp. HY002]|uniref:TetR family transcriptional regulator n=1 Tax=Gordonia zhenghanii TaxID=2911516 RepID=UPI001EF0FC9A|nr:TetR family transcriptional regulator [Gordonia zhenghanii]MCF8570739.1 TetR family transcriptional regulator [Gordonia zhenghanii]MCF8605697.1 TetR family transcriptional regulator [Gordonia zhenghanii]